MGSGQNPRKRVCETLWRLTMIKRAGVFYFEDEPERATYASRAWLANKLRAWRSARGIATPITEPAPTAAVMIVATAGLIAL